MGKSSLNSAKNNTPLNEYFVSDKRAPHIIGDKVGHFKINNLENRNLLKELANDSKSNLGFDKYGNQWNAKRLSSGEQLWIQIRGKEIINGGIDFKGL